MLYAQRKDLDNAKLTTMTINVLEPIYLIHKLLKLKKQTSLTLTL